MGTTFLIRRARLHNAPAILELLAILGYQSSIVGIERRVADCADSSDTAVFIAEAINEVAGVISFHRIPLFHTEGWLGRITSLVVAPNHRKRGVGRLLVAAVEEFARMHGCARMEVTSGDHRPEAHAFYEHLGYHVSHRRFIKEHLDLYQPKGNV